MTQEIFFCAGFGNLGFCCRQIALRRSQRTPRLAGFLQRAFQPCIAIKHLAMTTRVQQPAVIMLPMQFHKRFGQIAQHFPTDPAVIDPRSLAPVACVDPAQDQLVLNCDACVFQHRMCRMAER